LGRKYVPAFGLNPRDRTGTNPSLWVNIPFLLSGFVQAENRLTETLPDTENKTRIKQGRSPTAFSLPSYLCRKKGFHQYFFLRMSRV